MVLIDNLNPNTHTFSQTPSHTPTLTNKLAHTSSLPDTLTHIHIKDALLKLDTDVCTYIITPGHLGLSFNPSTVLLDLETRSSSRSSIESRCRSRSRSRSRSRK